MYKDHLHEYWNDIPIGKENAIEYTELCEKWGKNRRTVRDILEMLSATDNGDRYILIRSSHIKGFYKTDNLEEIELYRKEMVNRANNVYKSIKKINRVQSIPVKKCESINNLRKIREKRGFNQRQVCKLMQDYDPNLTCILLSNMENGYCMPTPYQLYYLARIYEVDPNDLINLKTFI